MKTLEAVIHELDPGALSDLTGHLLTMVNAGRARRIEEILAHRTRYLTVVLEDIYQSHNANAVIRSCECFGIQDIHVIEATNPFSVHSSIVQGSAKWITMQRYRGGDATGDCLASLQQSGYRLAAMDPQPGSLPLDELPVDRPVALCFGSEEPGLSGRARQMADVSVAIPMQGFTRSLNLSVSAGIALHALDTRIRRPGIAWCLTGRETDELRALWLARSLSAGARIVRRHLEHGAQR